MSNAIPEQLVNVANHFASGGDSVVDGASAGNKFQRIGSTGLGQTAFGAGALSQQPVEQSVSLVAHADRFSPTLEIV